MATQLLVYLMTLFFSYEELLAQSPQDEPIKLTDAEMNIIRKKISADPFGKEAAGSQDSGSAGKPSAQAKDPTTTVISFKSSGKKDKQSKLQLTEA